MVPAIYINPRVPIRWTDYAQDSGLLRWTLRGWKVVEDDGQNAVAACLFGDNILAVRNAGTRPRTRKLGVDLHRLHNRRLGCGKGRLF